MKSIKCICIDDKKRPSVIPVDKWITEGDTYHITHIFVQKLQGNIQGCEIAERDIGEYKPYGSFRLDRFGFNPEDLRDLIELAVDCAKLNDVTIDLNELTKKIKINE